MIVVIPTTAAYYCCIPLLHTTAAYYCCIRLLPTTAAYYCCIRLLPTTAMLPTTAAYYCCIRLPAACLPACVIEIEIEIEIKQAVIGRTPCDNAFYRNFDGKGGSFWLLVEPQPPYAHRSFWGKVAYNLHGISDPVSAEGFRTLIRRVRERAVWMALKSTLGWIKSPRMD